MSTLTLEAQARDMNAGKAKQLRTTGLVPVIVYGKRQTPVTLVVAERQLESTLHHGGSTRLVEVQVQGGGKHNVLIREVQRHPVNHRAIHADFYAVAMDEKQHVAVPLEGIGKPSALSSGLMVLQTHETIMIEALPADIPAVIEVDLTHLSVEHPIKTSDLPQLAGIAYLTDIDEHIFSLVATQAGEAEEAEVEAEASAEPALARKAKTEED